MPSYATTATVSLGSMMLFASSVAAGSDCNVVGLIRPEYRFGAENYVNTGTAGNNNANGCLGYCVDIAYAFTAIDFDTPLGLHPCKSDQFGSVGTFDYPIDQRFVYNPSDLRRHIVFEVEAGRCDPGVNCPADWVLPLRMCWEVDDSTGYVFIAECDHSKRSQKFKYITNGYRKGQLRYKGNKCVAADDAPIAPSNCNANGPCSVVDLSQCTTTGSFPWVGSGGNLCHQVLGMSVVDCPDYDDDFDYWSPQQRTIWRIGEEIPRFPDFCDNLDL